ncbi:response regulator transcription factor [Luteolibacter pohnpeiensis]|uniref:Response regulator transcription factor n=1 Tax=Luteolibacter pohnpeiensis TaxID=454153 RepID=A0A934VQ53_9BACT|nr:response regulator transcription factor [Luteolibacter pohnpeiensis]MBK1881751.1 response regulator transcription factor [Luteolibacter pohnpeiensis]
MRLLIVEDEPRLLKTLEKAFREQGYAVDAAADGEEGWYKASNIDYDAIILDVMLPAMDGWQILSKLRAIKSTPVLMLTARDTSPDRVKGLDGGADDYLVKPFDLPELFARVRSIIRRNAGQAMPVLHIDEICIDTRAREVTFSGSPVALTSREYSILEYLALHRGKLVTRTEIHDHLFDENEDTLSNLIDVHIFSIRKKLRSDLITTRRGQGYIIEL